MIKVPFTPWKFWRKLLLNVSISSPRTWMWNASGPAPLWRGRAVGGVQIESTSLFWQSHPKVFDKMLLFDNPLIVEHFPKTSQKIHRMWNLVRHHPVWNLDFLRSHFLPLVFYPVSTFNIVKIIYIHRCLSAIVQLGRKVETQEVENATLKISGVDLGWRVLCLRSSDRCP